MKKKILLAISLTCLMICLFAISAFAVEIDGIHYDLSGSGDSAVAKVNGTNKTGCALETVNIPEYVEHTVDGVTTKYKVVEIYGSSFGSTSATTSNNQAIKHLVIPSTVTKIGSHAFRNLANLETVVINSKSEEGISFSNAEFYGCSKLVSVDMSNSDVVRIGDHCFRVTGLQTVKFSPRLKSIGEQAFLDCKGLTSLDFSGTQLETLGYKSFMGCGNLETVKLSLTLKTISSNTFQSCKIQSLILPHGFNKTTGEAIPLNNSLYLMVFPELDETSSFSNSTFYGTYPEVVIYAGDKTSCENYLVGTESSKKLLYGYTVKHISEYDPTKTYTGKNLFYGAVTCKFCNGILEDERFDFSGYDKGFFFASKCTNCQKDNVTESYEPMFINSGYSFAEYEKGVITLGFRVNDESIAAYEKITGETVKYGLYAATEKTLGNNDILDENGEIRSGVISAEIPREQFSLLDIKIFGFNTEEQRNALFIIGAYVISEKNGAKTVSYIQDGTPTEGNKHAYVTFNGVVA